MITLTTPFVVLTSMGGTAGISYDRLDVITVVFDVVGARISGLCQLICSADGNQPPLVGNYNISAGATPQLQITIPTVDFSTSIALSGAQKSTLLTGVANAQNGVEAAMVNCGAVTGVQSAGL